MLIFVGMIIYDNDETQPPEDATLSYSATNVHHFENETND